MRRAIPTLVLVPVLALATAAGAALAQTPAEEAARRLEEGVQRDRLRDAAREARGEPLPTRPEVQQFDSQRRTLQPDVGRPEQGTGTVPDGTGSAAGMGPNPQR